MPEPILYPSAGSQHDSDLKTAGGKAARLLELSRLGLPVPRFFVIRAELFDEFLQLTGLREWLSAELARLPEQEPTELEVTSRRIQARLLATELPQPVAETIQRAHAELFSHGPPLAVRSSIVGEDSACDSFAGIHDSILGAQSLRDLLVAVRQVWCSAFSQRALSYRRQRGLAHAAIRPAVVVQELVPATASGIAFSRHPLATLREQILIQATWGLGTELVGGAVSGDSYLVDRQSFQTMSDLATKEHEWRFDAISGRVILSEIAKALRNQSSLTPPQLTELANHAVALEQRFGPVQDIEFCCDAQGKLWLVQSRDVCADAAAEVVVENHLIWDNSNIAESYSGVTLPLTFSFIRRVYAIVYHCFAEVMGVSPAVLQTNRRVYENLLGSIEGRVYYNLKSWYRALSLLPGFGYNRQFLETMMGVSQSLQWDERPPVTGWFRRWFVEFPALIRTLFRSIWNLARVNGLTAKFQRDFQSHYAEWSQLKLVQMSPSQLLRQYERLEDALLWNWKAPLIGDFHLMIFYGLLKRFCEKWCGLGGMQTELLRGTGEIESAAPARQLLELARLATAIPGLSQLILETDDRELPGLIAGRANFQEFHARFQNYISLYGFRCPEELKLESPSLKDEPARLYAILRHYLKLDKPELLDIAAIKQRDLTARDAAEARAFAALSQHSSWVPRKTIFRWVLNQARYGVRNRENMRFSRTRIFGLVREMFRSAGQSFTRAGQLNSPDDIFYLTADEVWDFVKGTAVTTDLRSLVSVRRREYEAYQAKSTPPANRFETFGVVYGRNSFQAAPTAAATVPPTRLLTGLGSCAGVATSHVACVVNPHEAKNVQGAILAGQRMDAGWVTLFPVVQGVLVEHGNILSHAAVVAREMGLPTIVSIPGLMSRLENGMTVRMDGQAGTVEILST